MSSAEKPSSPRISSVCSPTSGAAVRTEAGVRDSVTGGRWRRISPSARCLTGTASPRCWTCSLSKVSLMSRMGPGGTPLAFSSSTSSAPVLRDVAFSSSTVNAFLFFERSGAVLKRGSSSSGSVPRASQSRRNICWPEAAMLKWPSDVLNTPVGMLVGWSLPACGGMAPSISQRAAWKSSMVTMASSRDVCTHCPLPERSRSMSAQRMPCARKIPAVRSATGMPTRTGPCPCSPVMDMSPPMPCAIWS